MRTLACLLALAAATACSKPDPTPAERAEPDERAVADALPVAAAAPRASTSGAGACLLRHNGALDALLSAQDARDAVGRSGAEDQRDYRKLGANPAGHELSYSWKSERVREQQVLGHTLTVPQDDRAWLAGAETMTLAQFKARYRPLTSHEQQEVNARVDDHIDASKDPRLASPAAKPAAKPTARALVGVLAEVTQAYEDVPDLGLAASFNRSTSQLYVLVGSADDGVRLALGVNRSNDPAVNRSAAIALARRVLERCR